MAAVFLLAGCASPQEPQETGPQLAQKDEIMEYETFDLDTWLKPFWDTREVYNETVLFVGEEDEAPLLYRPAHILSVRNYGLDVVYEEGKDYAVTEDGKIKRLKNSEIPYFEVDEYYRDEPDSVPIAVFGNPGGYNFPDQRYIKYGEGDTFTSRQIAVTYEHDSPWQGSVPAGKAERFRPFLEKLEKGEQTTVVFYGDSITVGCNASGTSYGGNIPPHTPSYPDLVVSFLEEKYGGKIECVNTAVGGQKTEWGLENVEERVNRYSPDLVVLAFGMNDSDLTIAKYERLIAETADKIREASPDCCIVAVATTVPNNETDWFYGNQKEYVKGLNDLEAKEGYEFLAVADMTTMHLDLLNAGKRFRDMTGNNINHPNDFLVRAYAQVILKTILGDGFRIGGNA